MHGCDELRDEYIRIIVTVSVLLQSPARATRTPRRSSWCPRRRCSHQWSKWWQRFRNQLNNQEEQERLTFESIWVTFVARSTTMSGTRTSVDCSSPRWLSGCRRWIAFNDLDLCKEFLVRFEKSWKGSEHSRDGRVEKAKIAAETVDSKKTTSEFAATKTNDSGGNSDCDATCWVHRGDDTESSGDDHQLRVWTKVRQQVEQWRKERKQKEVQNWRVRLIRYRHMFDDDSLREVVESNDPWSPRWPMVTVCPQCKTVFKFGVMECHATMSKFVMECNDEVTTGNGRCFWFSRTRCRQATSRWNQQCRDSIREGTVKQYNDKTWKATHLSQREQKSIQSREYSDWKMLAGGSSEWGRLDGSGTVWWLREGSREFNNNVGRASWAVERTQMQNIVMDENSNRIHSSKKRLNSSTTYKRISTSLEMQSTSNAVITQNVMVKCLRKHQRKSFDEGHECESQGAVQVHHMVWQAISDELQ